MSTQSDLVSRSDNYRQLSQWQTTKVKVGQQKFGFEFSISLIRRVRIWSKAVNLGQHPVNSSQRPVNSRDPECHSCTLANSLNWNDTTESR
ncbi:hypothetical protein HanXRQr2_Chr05g0204821 [Helianthus annuus]|uniref:Uncharacterized protein n=1 Tax=Helianthus annuus TaxID=4232 RepID=A0A251UNE0_HELAN|nr:hypothetical protein HanXRQr2_Chr05g0204821 [Helianthus annuus]KAJ0921932.1 hypothetical protein HanPSC8_Chr05g0197551 [Helianthus annuus]